MERSYYLDYFELERKHWWFRARSRILRDQVAKIRKQKNEPLKILNVGIATGASSVMLAEFGWVTSIEYDELCCAFVREKVGIEVLQGSITELQFPANSFDLVCAFDVIEHVQDDQKAAQELQRVCNSGGHVLVTVPAFQSLWSAHDEVNHHFRRYKKNQFKKLFSAKGKILFSSYFNFFLFPPIWCFRSLSNLFTSSEKKKNPKSDFESAKTSFFSPFLFQIMLAEKYFLGNKISFPFGVSVFLKWIKTP